MTEQRQKTRYPKNVPGPFFVANGECIICRAPEYAAPDLMGFDEEDKHCYFKKQPSTPDEIIQAAKAVVSCCCEAVIYEGDDPTIHQKIVEAGLEMIESTSKKLEWKFWRCS